MKMNVPFKTIGEIEDSLIDEIINLIEPNHWYINQVRNTMGNLEKTQSIIFRYFDDYKNVANINFKDSFKDYDIFDVYRPTINKVIEELKKHYEFSNYMCFLAKLMPNSEVGTHVDSGFFLEKCHRIHIPIKTNSEVFYIIDNKKNNWLKGKIYEFDNTRPHGVLNNSSEERIHLMFNLYK